MDRLIASMRWSREILKEKLDKADCIKIENGEPTKFGFKRSGMGIYYFNVFYQPILEKLIKKYNDSCKYILVNKKIVLKYSNGVIGSQCFYNLD